MTIGALTLLITLLAGHEVFIRWQQLNRIEALIHATQLGDALFDAGADIAMERHIAYSMLYTSDRSSLENLKQRLAKSRRATNSSVAVVLPLLEEDKSTAVHSDSKIISSDIQELHKLRAEVDKDVLLPVDKRDPKLPDLWFRSADGQVEHMQVLWRKIINEFNGVNPVVNAQMRFKYSLWVITEYTGRERSIIGRLIAQNALATPKKQAQLMLWQGTVDYFWTTIDASAGFSHLTPALTPYLKDAKSDYANVYDMLQGTFLQPGVKITVPYPISAELWIELSTQSDQSLYKLKDEAKKKTRTYVSALEKSIRREIASRFATMLMTLLLCVYSFWVVVVRILRPINTMVGALVSATLGKVVSPVLMSFKQDDEIGKLAHVLSVFQKNVEELERSSITLRRYVEELKQSNQALDDFAYIASHDLKEPLRGLTTQSTFLLEDYQSKLDMEAIRRLRRIVFLSQRLEKLISELLYFSRLGRTELAIQKTDPNAVISEIRTMLGVFLKERNAEVRIPNPLPSVVCDKLKLAEVFRNLITNGIKYNDKKKRLIEIGFLEKAQAPHGPEQNVFYVKDNGIGIEPQFHDAIFRIFKRLKDPAVKDEDGTGSGLTFVKKIIERHKGHIWLESEPGKGSTFYFTIGSIKT